MRSLPFRVLLCASFGLGGSAAMAAEEGGTKPWALGEIRLPEPLKHPLLACTADELERLRAAYRKGAGEAFEAVDGLVQEARKGLGQPLEFPPRGGQHNQWYQCEPCQLALQTVDATHHKCSKCGKVYSGPPYDDVLFAKTHGENLRRMRDAAWAFAITGEQACLEFARKVLLGYAERYAQYPYHDNQQKQGPSGGHLNEQTLDEASKMAIFIAPAFDLLFDALAEEERDKIQNGLILPMLKNMDKHKAGKSNWQTWHNAALLAGGAVLHDAGWIKKALTQAGNGFVDQMKLSVTGDGMWYENSWGYHFYTLSALVILAEGSRRLGLDLWSHPAFKKMFTLPARYSMPNGFLPRWGDDVNSSALKVADRMEPAYHAFRDPLLLALLPGKPSWLSVLYGRDPSAKAEPAKLTSAVFKAAGHAILRSEGPAGLAAAFTFGPFGGFHGHFDKLSFVFYGFGQELGVDPGRAKSQAYGLPIHTKWYRATLGHNAVLVDGKSQEGAEGKLELFAAHASFAAVKAACETAYTGVRHERLLALAPEYLLVWDELKAGDAKARRFTWLYHGQGKLCACEAAVEPGKLKDVDGAEYIQHLKVGMTDAAVCLRFESEKVTAFVHLDAAQGTRVATGDGPWTSIEDRVPMALVERNAGRFLAALEPVAVGQKPTVKGVRMEEREGGVRLIVLREGNEDAWDIGSGRKLTLTRDGEAVQISE